MIYHTRPIVLLISCAIIIQLLALSVHSKSDRRIADGGSSSSSSSKKLSQLLANLKIVDFIDNGWIELNPTYTSEHVDKFVVKCDSSFAVNSNASFVRKQSLQQLLFSKSKAKSSKKASDKYVQWTPVNDYQIKDMPLCAKRCRYQSYLPNGLIQIDSLHKLDEDSELNQQQQQSNAMFVNLIENSRIKFECVNGFQLQRTQLDQLSPAPVLLNRASLVEQCVLTESEQQQRKDFAVQQKAAKSSSKNKADDKVAKKKKSQKKEEDDEEKDDDDEDDDELKEKRDASSSLPAAVVSSSVRAQKQPTAMPGYFYECVKFCPPFRTQPVKSNGFVVPVRELFAPGDQLTYLCHEGYAVEMPVYDPTAAAASATNASSNETTQQTTTVAAAAAAHTKISNMNTFVCSMNGTWHLILSQGLTNSNRQSSMLISPNEIKTLPRCLNLRDLLQSKENDESETGEQSSSSSSSDAQAETASSAVTANDQLVYTELNIRSLCLMLTVGGILTVFLVLSVLALKFYKTRRDNILYHNYLPQLDNQIFEPSPLLPPPPPPPPAHGSIASPIADLSRSMAASSMRSSSAAITAASAAAYAHDRARLLGPGAHQAFQSCLVPPVIPRSMPLLNSGHPCRTGASLFDNQMTAGLALPSYEEAVQQQQLNQNEPCQNGANAVHQPAERVTTTTLGNIFHVNQILRSNPLTAAVSSTANTSSLAAASSMANQFALGGHLFVTANTSSLDEEKAAAAPSTTAPSLTANCAYQQPPPPPYNNNPDTVITTNELDRSAVATVTAAAVSAHQQEIVTSRSGSIRSNTTVRSANPSIRTTNSIGTSSSIGNTSLNMTVAACASSSRANGAHTNKKSSLSKSMSRKSSSSHTRHHHYHNQRSAGAENKSLRSTTTATTAASAQETLSTRFDPDASTTRTVNSFQSDRSDASKVALKGSVGSVLGSDGRVMTGEAGGGVSQSQPLHDDAVSSTDHRVDDRNAFVNDENERLLAHDNESSSSPSGSSVDLSVPSKMVCTKESVQ